MRWGAHPRVSGENVNDAGIRVDPSGSSPRERGKPQAASHVAATIRLIPA